MTLLPSRIVAIAFPPRSAFFNTRFLHGVPNSSVSANRLFTLVSGYDTRLTREFIGQDTMQLVKASEVQKITGLTGDQLREWTTRRRLIEPDAKPNGPGTRARYSWQTVLLLRVAVVLKNQFHVELQSQKALFSCLSRRLEKTSLPALRGMALVMHAGGTSEILAVEEVCDPTSDFLTIRLDPHLDVLSTEFGMVEPMRQLPLFPARAVA